MDGKSFASKKGTTFLRRATCRTPTVICPGRLMCVITPAGFEGFFEAIGALSPEQQQDLSRVMAIAKEFGLQFLPQRTG